MVGNGRITNGMTPDQASTKNTLASYRKGVGVWVEDAERVWITATVENDDFYDGEKRKGQLLLRLENGQTRAISINDLSTDLPPLRNPDFLIDTSDLTSLSYLHEPDVLHSLRTRFGMSHIYTYCGIVLVAINPYSECGIYGMNIFDIYRDQNVRQLDPHIYAVAEEAFASLTRYNKSQSIIISGESGAGKTVSAKHVMQYLAEACSRSGTVGNGHMDAGQQRIEARVLASNPIMEAIGNAKTIRNDNSSRFGKFIQILFDNHSVMCGAVMRTYLLEKSRVVGLNDEERNYHIFYQLCAARENDPILKNLELADAREFSYLNSGNCTKVDSVDDVKNFTATKNAMVELGFSLNDVAALFRILAGLLHFGNIKFDPKADSAALVDSKSANHLRTCCKLWEINEQEMTDWLKHRRFRAPDTDVKKPFSLEEANGARDASAKMVYAKLFDKVVARINQSLGSEHKAQDSGTRFVGVLDIYGFEIFTSNSFEQLCINYANEMLQQQFTQHVFKLEQQEYEKEGIEWSRIDFSDNQACLDLIENRLGILDLLDQECKKAPSTDKNWYTNMTTTNQVKGSSFFVLPRVRGGRSQQFVIRHFASDVTYDVDGFVEKNLDAVNAEQVEVMKRSKLALLSDIMFDCGLTDLNGPAGGTMKRSSTQQGGAKKSIATQFRESLKGLKAVLDSTMPHYVRCIKPNDSKSPWTFCTARSVEQLRACGVLETIRISAAGYPSRWAYEEFRDRYRMLAPNLRQTSPSTNPRTVAAEICNLYLEKDKFALGRTKVFFRTGQVALLESLRSEKLRSSAVMIQKTFRGYVARKRYAKIRGSVKIIQAVGKAWLAWRYLKFIQMHRAAIAIQSRFRGYIQRKKYLAIRRSIVAIQARWRARIVRIQLWQFRAEQKIIIVQKTIRGFLARQQFKKTLRAVVLIQCWFRRYLAKKELKRLRVEARSVNHLQNLNKGLENKIISLQQRLNQLIEEREMLKHEVSSISDLRNQVSRMSIIEIEMVKLKAASDEQDVSNKRMQQQVENLMTELLETKDSLEAEQAKNAELSKQLAKQKIIGVQNGHHSEEGMTNGYHSMVPKRPSSLGMIQVIDLNAFMRSLIHDMKPDVACKHDPKTLAAYLVFMAIRYEDYVEQENMRIYEIFDLTVKAIKDVIRERFDFDTCILWLATTWRLYQLFKQYSGSEEYMKYSTAAQLEHVVKIQSMEDFEHQLEPLMSHLYIITVTDILEPMIATKIVPAVLEHKETEKQRATKYGTLSKLRPRPKTTDAMQDLLDQLTFIHDKFTLLGVDYPVISQMFTELMGILTSSSFNRLMFRRDFCTHAAAIQIKHNVTLVQNWLRDHNLSADTLQPLMEACHLLQARKSEQDIDGFHEMCSTLNVGQICRLLTHYKSEGMEAQLLPEFIEKVDDRLRKKRNLRPGEPQPPLLSSSKSPTLEFSFVPSSVSLDAVQVPASLKSIVRKL